MAAVAVVGAKLRIVGDDGRPLPTADLIGAKLTLRDADTGRSVRVRIDSITPDPEVETDPVLLYGLSAGTATSGWQVFCTPDPDGRRLAVLQPATGGGIAIWCTSGVLAKCVRFGYLPWGRGRHCEPLAPYHRACSYMMRADYCGDDRPTTRNGMPIDIYDRLDNQRSEADPAYGFEAAWDEHGAVCVAHPRVPQNISLEQLAKRCPRLRGQLGPTCTREHAERIGRPLLFNGSRGDGIPRR